MRGWRGERGSWYKTLFILHRVEELCISGSWVVL